MPRPLFDQVQPWCMVVMLVVWMVVKCSAVWARKGPNCTYLDGALILRGVQQSHLEGSQLGALACRLLRRFRHLAGSRPLRGVVSVVVEMFDVLVLFFCGQN